MLFTSVFTVGVLHKNPMHWHAWRWNLPELCPSSGQCAYGQDMDKLNRLWLPFSQHGKPNSDNMTKNSPLMHSIHRILSEMAHFYAHAPLLTVCVWKTNKQKKIHKHRSVDSVMSWCRSKERKKVLQLQKSWRTLYSPVFLDGRTVDSLRPFSTNELGKNKETNKH